MVLVKTFLSRAIWPASQEGAPFMMILARATIGIAALTATTFAAIAAKEHDNEVFFAINGLQSFTFNETSHDVTSGQPYGGVTSTITDDGQVQVTVKAGRKGSEEVATWFKDQVYTGQTLVCDSKETYPDGLNFAVKGTLTIGSVNGDEITCNDIIIAQGRSSRNNWWMGGPHMKGAHLSYSGVTEQSCKITGKDLPAIVVFTPQTPCVNNFNIGVNQPSR
jgi:hypothetical protein